MACFCKPKLKLEIACVYVEPRGDSLARQEIRPCHKLHAMAWDHMCSGKGSYVTFPQWGPIRPHNLSWMEGSETRCGRVWTGVRMEDGGERDGVWTGVDGGEDGRWRERDGVWTGVDRGEDGRWRTGEISGKLRLKGLQMDMIVGEKRWTEAVDEACFRVSLKHASLWAEIFRRLRLKGWR